MTQRYIDANALLEQDPEICADYGPEFGCEFGYSRDQIENAPTVSPDEVRGVGYWIEICPTPSWQFTWEHYKCSACDAVSDATYNYCPNCGVLMKGADNDPTDRD